MTAIIPKYGEPIVEEDRATLEFHVYLEELQRLLSAQAVETRDEGTPLTTLTATMDFVGTGVTATAAGDNVTVTIPGGSAVEALDEGSSLTASLASLNFTGTGVTATNVGDAVTVDIPSSSATPGGSDTHVQYNNAGAFGGSADLTFNDTTDILAVGDGTVAAPEIRINAAATTGQGAVSFLQNGIEVGRMSYDDASDLIDFSVAGNVRTPDSLLVGNSTGTGPGINIDASATGGGGIVVRQAGTIRAQIQYDDTGDTLYLNSQVSTGSLSFRIANNERVSIDTNRMTNSVGYAADIKTLTDSATPSVQLGQAFITGGTTTITDFANGATGQIIHILSEHSITITDGTNIFLNGSANFNMVSSDSLTLIQKADGNWYELSRSVN